MSDKPMLSVERDLIERASRQLLDWECADDGEEVRRTFVELRALLDKPAEPSKFVGAAQYWSENEQALRDVCKFEGLKGLVYQVVRDRDRPAAQHQGEPVRWERMSKMMGGAWWPCANKAEADEAVTCGWTVRPLYAEQPAPVDPQGDPVAQVVRTEWSERGNSCDVVLTIPGNLKVGDKLYRQRGHAKHTMWSVMEAVGASKAYTVLTSNQCKALADALNEVKP